MVDMRTIPLPEGVWRVFAGWGFNASRGYEPMQAVPMVISVEIVETVTLGTRPTAVSSLV